MLPRATQLLKVIEGEISRRDRAIENDINMGELVIRIKFDHAAEPVKIHLASQSETDIRINAAELRRRTG